MDKDIRTLLSDIRQQTGWSELKIAGEILVSQPTVHRILAGQPDCKARTYQAILGLHARVCSDASPAILPSIPKEAPCQPVS